MSDYLDVIVEKAKLDELIGAGYRIASVTESLDGDLFRFARADGATKELLLLTADARKYAVGVLIAQLRNPPA